jgi:acetate kinase
LHNTPEIEGIKVCMKLFNAPQIAVFDTAFHQTMPEHSYTYALPHDISKKHKIRRYGFHGTSHKYVSHEAARILGKEISRLKLISCHLGNGCSIAAIKHGKSVDTSMGFTPLEGLVMGTRSGDLDPAIIPFLMHNEKYSYKKIEEMLNKKSGLFGLCGKSDMREIHESTTQEARLAEDIFCYRLTKYIGAYIAAMDGCDAIIFTGGIGEHAYWIREKILSHFGHAGIKLDSKDNRENKLKITKFSSRINVLVIPTNEELMIAKEVRRRSNTQIIY